MTWRQHIAAALVFIALSLAMTWPLAVNLGRAVADPGDPYINIWILDWDWWATVHQPLSLFHANAFHPAKYSLAYSENLYGIAMLLFPLRFVGVDPITAYNIAMLAGFALCGYAAWLLGRRLTGSFAAGLAAGVFYAFVPFRFVHATHVQHVWGGWLPLLLVALLAYAEQPTRKRAALFAAAFAMNGLTNIHYLLFGAFASAVTAALLLPRRAWRNLALATLIALVVLAPFLYPYAAVAKLYGMQRGSEEVLRYSAIASDWLGGSTEPERRLFPGVLAFIGAAAALAFARKEKPKVALGLIWIVIGFLGSLGLNFEFHRFLYGAVPGFRAIRAPARWAVIAYIGLAILIALATAVLARRNRWLPFLAPVALVLELWQAPIRWYITDPRPPEVHRWLATQNVKGIVEIPIDSLGSEYEAMLRATAHHKPIVNGISGFVPPERVELSASSNADPIGEDFVDALTRARVDLLIVHADALGGRSAAERDWLNRELARKRISFVGRFDSRVEGDWVFRIGGPDAPRPRDLETFLIGAPTCGDSTIGSLDFPDANFTFDRGSAMFSGWTMSPHGIRSVDLWFNNHTVRHRATLHPGEFRDRCPERRDLTRVRFILTLDERPAKIWRDTDVQVEVTDGRGESVVFESRWIRWQ